MVNGAGGCVEGGGVMGVMGMQGRGGEGCWEVSPSGRTGGKK